MVSICFVCTANICRSPTAEGIFTHLVDGAGLLHRFMIDSAGTDAMEGAPPDRRSATAAAARGVELHGNSRPFVSSDFDMFDYVIAVDAFTLGRLSAHTNDESLRSKIWLLRDFDPATPPGADVPDPYRGGREGFAHVFDLVEAACRGLLEHLRAKHELEP